MSGDNDNDATNLQACTGECDTNTDCAGSLECFQRENGDRFLGARAMVVGENGTIVDPSTNKPVDVKYQFNSRRLLNPRISGPSRHESRFAHHMLPLDGTSPKCHPRSIMNKVYCKPVESDSDRD